jgi:hypothetical protein
MLRVVGIIRRWPSALICLCLHTVFVALIWRITIVSPDPNSPMFWLYPIQLDLPSSLILLPIRATSWPEWQFAIAVFVIGGLQWIVWGALFDLFLRRRARMSGQRP